MTRVVSVSDSSSSAWRRMSSGSRGSVRSSSANPMMAARGLFSSCVIPGARRAITSSFWARICSSGSGGTRARASGESSTAVSYARPTRGGRPLSWPLTEEERLLQQTAREFAQREVAPTAIERDEAERFDRGIFSRMGELGLTGAPIPESAGGAGFSYVGWSLVMEELGAADMASAVTLSVHLLSQLPGRCEER